MIGGVLMNDKYCHLSITTYKNNKNIHKIDMQKEKKKTYVTNEKKKRLMRGTKGGR